MKCQIDENFSSSTYSLNQVGGKLIHIGEKKENPNKTNAYHGGKRIKDRVGTHVRSVATTNRLISGAKLRKRENTDACLFLRPLVSPTDLKIKEGRWKHAGVTQKGFDGKRIKK